MSLSDIKLIHKLTGHTYTVKSVTISSDSKYIISGSEDRTINIGEIETGTFL